MIRRSLVFDEMIRDFNRIGVGAKQYLLMFAFSLLYALFEGVGVGLLLPILEYAEAGGTPPETGAWDRLLAIGTWLGFPISLATLLVLAFIPILLRQASFFLSEWYSTVVQQKAVTRLRERGFAAYMLSDMAYVSSVGQGETLAILYTHTTRASGVVGALSKMQATAALIVVYAGVLVFLSPGLSAFAVLALLGVSLLLRGNLRNSRLRGRELAVQMTGLNSFLVERIQTIRLVKMRNQEGREIRSLESLAVGIEKTNVRIAVLRNTLEVLVDPALMLAVFAILYAGIELLGMSLAGLGVFLFVILRLNAKVKEFNIHRQTLSTLVESLHMVDNASAAAIKSRSIVGGSLAAEQLTGQITFHNVDFCYGEGQPVLSDVSLSFPKGSMSAIVGRSGSGKSTLVDLIPRFQQPTAGRIALDGHEIAEFDLRSLRERIGLLTQEAVLFNDTVRANLTYGMEHDPDDLQIEQALRDAYAWEFIQAMPLGLDEPVGERGGRLSGGERQRLALARELLRQPDILLLDEPTSALDSESEHYIQQALARLRGTKTLIIVAHRLSTVRDADQIFVLDQGRIVERGHHDELLALGGHYAHLFATQIRGA